MAHEMENTAIFEVLDGCQRPDLRGDGEFDGQAVGLAPCEGVVKHREGVDERR